MPAQSEQAARALAQFVAALDTQGLRLGDAAGGLALLGDEPARLSRVALRLELGWVSLQTRFPVEAAPRQALVRWLGQQGGPLLTNALGELLGRPARDHFIELEVGPAQGRCAMTVFAAGERDAVDSAEQLGKAIGLDLAARDLLAGRASYLGDGAPCVSAGVRCVPGREPEVLLGFPRVPERRSAEAARLASLGRELALSADTQRLIQELDPTWATQGGFMRLGGSARGLELRLEYWELDWVALGRLLESMAISVDVPRLGAFAGALGAERPTALELGFGQGAAPTPRITADLVTR
ncbi:MAG: hypothetical protein IT370_03800 [Deltaproteobacteria bacterium]|nr:hypothetical protein [Deltaproteobacteria bacterium]